jgi:EAL domain-containing protein (putative c-di-GMP-specific phosphodiesterase class I)/GGDEF domain-containing protein
MNITTDSGNLLSAPEFEARVSADLNKPNTTAPPTKLLLVGFGGIDLLVGDLGTEGARAVLREIGVRLASLVSEGTPGAHLFGDRFAILLKNGVSSKQVTERVLRALNAPICFRGEENIMQPRFGMAGTMNANGTKDLLRRATAALQRAETSGGRTPALYETNLMPLHATDPRLARDLESALDRGEITPWMQPIWRLSDDKMVAVEALARWEHPSRGLIQPSTFLPLARKSGLLGRLDAAIRSQSMQWLSDMRSKFEAARGMTVAVNVADADLLDPELLDVLTTELKQFGLPENSVHLELSERAQTATTPEIQSRIRKIAAAGFSWHLDDFGTGHSNIQRLRGLPFKVVKLDRSMVRGLGRDHHAEHLLKPMIALARVLNLEIIAEGVERPEQLQTLKRLGVDMAQGFHLSPPRPQAAIEQLLCETAVNPRAAQGAQ